MTPTHTAETKLVHANGIDIHYVEQGQGPPLVLLHGGATSTNPIWKGHGASYVSHMGALAEHFRVIAPDTRGCGRTVHRGGSTGFARLADDVVALAGALGLERPALCGFSEGGITATLVGIRAPGLASAIVNDAAYDLFNPTAKTFTMMRQVFGGSPTATQVNHEAFTRFFSASDEMREMLERLKADQDAGQGRDHWKTYLELAFEDLRAVTAPTLILTGDRDQFCTVEEAVIAYRKLGKGELCVLPQVGHVITPSKIQATLEFLRRHRAQ